MPFQPEAELLTTGHDGVEALDLSHRVCLIHQAAGRSCQQREAGRSLRMAFAPAPAGGWIGVATAGRVATWVSDEGPRRETACCVLLSGGSFVWGSGRASCCGDVSSGDARWPSLKAGPDMWWGHVSSYALHVQDCCPVLFFCMRFGLAFL
jgi:hypothetical protein